MSKEVSYFKKGHTPWNKGKTGLQSHFLEARKKMNEFLEILKEKEPFKVERELKRKAGNFTVIISKE